GQRDGEVGAGEDRHRGGPVFRGAGGTGGWRGRDRRSVCGRPGPGSGIARSGAQSPGTSGAINRGGDVNGRGAAQGNGGSTDEVIVTRDLQKHYVLGAETVRALRGVDLTINRNEYVAIM